MRVGQEVRGVEGLLVGLITLLIVAQGSETSN